MKKTMFFLIFIASLLAFSCSNDFGIPEKIYIKTNTQYNYSLGNFTQDLAEYLSVDTLRDSISSENNMSIYDYNPNGTCSVQKYMIDMAISEIPVNIGEYLSNMNFSESLKGMSFDRDIEIPDVSSGVSCSETIELPDINKKIRSSASIADKTIPVPGSGSITSVTLPMVISNPTFKNIEFSGGYMQVSISSADAPANMTANIIMKVETSSGTSSGSVTVTGSESAVLNIPLTGATFGKNFNVDVSGNASGGSGIYSYKMSFGFSEDLTIRKITGLSMDLGSDGVIAIDKNIEMSSNGSFVSSKIKTGHVAVVSAMPSGWENVGVSSSLSFAGGLTASDGDIGSGAGEAGKSYFINRYLDLAEKTYYNKAMQVKGSLALTLDDSTLVLEGVSSVSLKVDCSIEELDSVTVDLSDMKDNFTVSVSETLPSSLQESVQYIDLAESGFTAEYENGLPEGNDITVEAYSGFFGLGTSSSPKTVKLLSGTTGKSESVELKTDSGVIKRIEPASDKNVDFLVNLKLPGATSEHPYYAVLSNIKMGETYKLKMNVTPVFDWKKVGLKSSIAGTEALKDTIDTGFNVKSVFSGLTDVLKDDTLINKLKFTEVPVYLYAVAPKLDVFNDVEFTGSINGVVGSQSHSLMKDGDKIKASTEKIALITGGDDMVVSDLENSKYSYKTDLAEIVNSHLNSGSAADDTLKIEYNFELSTGQTGIIEITKEEFESIKESSEISIKLSARIVMPLMLEFIDDVSLDILKLGGLDDRTDIFERTSPTDTSDYDKYIDIIQKMILIYTVNNNLLQYTDGVTVGSVSFVSTDPVMNKVLNLSSGTFDFETSELRRILQVCNFMPTMTLNAPKGTVVVPRNASITMNSAIRIYANGKVSVWEA